MLPARIRAAGRALVLDTRVRTARRREADALARTGALPAVSPGARVLEGLRPLVERVTEGYRRRDALEAGLAAVREADRADYAAVAPWVRPLVILRGLCTSAVLRHQWARAGRDLEVACAALGAAAIDGRDHPAVVPPVLADAVVTARADAEAAAAERAALLAPFGGTALPQACHHAVRETTQLGRALWLQIRGRLLPRAPALAGMAAGWWATHAYTDSHWRATLGALGFGSGGTGVVDPETHQAMNFWLPILAAGLCAYIGSRLAAAVRFRYGTGRPPDPAGSPVTAGMMR